MRKFPLLKLMFANSTKSDPGLTMLVPSVTVTVYNLAPQRQSWGGRCGSQGRVSGLSALWIQSS